MALTMLGVRYKNDKRDLYLQHGGWFVKVGLWLLFNALPFFLPVGLVNSYGNRITSLPFYPVQMPRPLMDQSSAGQACVITPDAL